MNLFSTQNLVGIQLYSLKEIIPNDTKLIFKKLSLVGFKEIETYGYSNGHFWGMRAEELKEELIKNKLTTPSGHYGLESVFYGKLDELKEIIEVAKILNQKYVVIPSIPSHLRKSKSDYIGIAEKLNIAGKLCKQSGLKLAYHNHAFEFEALDDSKTNGYELLLEHTNSDIITFEIDIYWVVRAGINPIALFTKYPGRFKLWHIKDMDKNNRELNTEIGSGNIDFQKMILYKEKSGVEHFTLEQENFEIDPFESLEKSYKYISRTLLN
ncbi:sugar phosphate isomerase/epimerase [Christiangramia sp.]|uniref:sugar phosphate isomerase/epimerase family protein n=1 Tax=Christiangramia sp. TaxID=1931228 RepID=UPI00261E45D5|nr:sugar phosphate isomerase/epimerase [Christiangramia sp.]